MLWQDRWIDSLPFLQHQGMMNEVDLECSVSDFLKDGW